MQQHENKTQWRTVITPQFLQIVTGLEESKNDAVTRMFIGSTGTGKTYAIKKFVKQHGEETYVITVHDVYKLDDIIEELCERIGLGFNTLTGIRMKSYSKKIRMDKIVERLIEIKQFGGNPMLIFDEAENMNISVLKSIKALYDRLKDHCAIVLIGTSRLIERMLNTNGKNKGRNREALPELYSRFKAGVRYITPVTAENFTPFLERYVEDKALRKLICDTLESYRDLNTHLLPVMCEAEKLKEPVTERLYKLYHEIYN